MIIEINDFKIFKLTVIISSTCVLSDYRQKLLNTLLFFQHEEKAKFFFGGMGGGS